MLSAPCEDCNGLHIWYAAGASIFTEADTIEQLRHNVRDAVNCHFDKAEARPQVVRLHFTRDEVIAL